MNTSSRVFAAIGALSAATSVVIGAATAHAVNSDIAAQQSLIQTALHYQQFHALGLLAVGLLGAQRPSRWLLLAGLLMCAGSVLFSGNLYLRAFADIQTFRALVPVGGGLLIFSWLALAIGLLRRSSRLDGY